jgi:hypothetical protein
MADDLRTQTPEQTLTWEAERSRTAGLCALGAAVLTIAGLMTTGLALSGLPDGDDRVLSVLDTLGRAASGEDGGAGRLAVQTAYLGDHATLPIVGSLLFGVGTLLLFPPMAYLFRATRARRPAFGQLALILLAIGVVGFGVGRTVAEMARYIGAAGFEGGSNSEAAEALTGSTLDIAGAVWQMALFALGFSFVIICLNAMRTGLLTRFMGILGVIVGATFVLPLDQQGIIRAFWIGALGALILHRWPSGVPRAWTEGVAVPWPTQQEIREQREAARREAAGEPPDGDGDGDGDDDADGEAADPRLPPPARRPEPVTATAHPSSKKRKRKRR